MAAHVLKYSKHAIHVSLTKEFYRTHIKSMNIPRDVPYSVMDVGCGDGKVLFEVLHPLLPTNYKEIMALDKDESMIEYCKSYNENPNISFFTMNIETNQLPKTLENRFDVIFSAYCFMLVKNLRQGLTNCRKMLKPNGEILLFFIAKKCPLYSIYAELCKIDTWRPYTKDYEGFVPHFSSDDPDTELNSIFKHVKLEVLSKEFMHESTYNSKKRDYLEKEYPREKVSINSAPISSIKKESAVSECRANIIPENDSLHCVVRRHFLPCDKIARNMQHCQIDSNKMGSFLKVWGYMIVPEIRLFFEVLKAMDTIYRTIPEPKREEYERDFKRGFSEVTGVDVMDETKMDESATVHIPNVLIHARKS